MREKKTADDSQSLSGQQVVSFSTDTKSSNELSKDKNQNESIFDFIIWIVYSMLVKGKVSTATWYRQTTRLDHLCVLW